jgi:ATP-dependent Clp protease protease subunit
MKNTKSIYGDKANESNNDSKQIDDLTKDKFSELSYSMDIDDGIIYMIGEIGEFSFYDLATRCRTILRERPAEKQNDPITIVLNSSGGCMFEMFGIIDYIKSLKVKVNVIVRGQAMSAGAMILATATGSRICSKHTTIMLHEASIGQYGKSSDIQASAKQYKKMEDDCLRLLAESTKKDAEWWKENTRKDLFLSADEALELGIIDLIG